MLAAYLPGLADDTEVIVVDDGSSDDTAAIVERIATVDARVRMLRHPVNLGKGCAVRTGVLNSTGDRVLFTDADGSFPVSEVARLMAALDEGADLAIGSRARPVADGHIPAPPVRRLAGWAFQHVVRAGGVRGIADTQCGFKLLTAEAAAALFSRIHTTGFAFDVELLMLAQRDGFRIVPVAVHWNNQAGSRVRVVRDGLRMTMEVLKIRARIATSR